MQKTYDWTRYWYRRGSAPPVSPDGFLYVSSVQLIEPDASLVQFSEKLTVQCLVMLGEPGIGKSYDVRDAYKSVSARSGSANERARLINLKEYSEAELARDLDAILNDFATADYALHLFLDSLDEARIRISTITHILHRRLESVLDYTSRLYLRVVCRTGDWPVQFEEGLRKFWSDENVQVYILAPLQQQDVKMAAHANSIDAEEFLSQVHRRDVGALAANPITLELLMSSYASSKMLPYSRATLYYDGCLELCRERDQTHEVRDTLRAEQRLAVAARIAACTLLTNSYAVAQDTGIAGLAPLSWTHSYATSDASSYSVGLR